MRLEPQLDRRRGRSRRARLGVRPASEASPEPLAEDASEKRSESPVAPPLMSASACSLARSGSGSSTGWTIVQGARRGRAAAAHRVAARKAARSTIPSRVFERRLSKSRPFRLSETSFRQSSMPGTLSGHARGCRSARPTRQGSSPKARAPNTPCRSGSDFAAVDPPAEALLLRQQFDLRLRPFTFASAIDKRRRIAAARGPLPCSRPPETRSSA